MGSEKGDGTAISAVDLEKEPGTATSPEVLERGRGTRIFLVFLHLNLICFFFQCLLGTGGFGKRAWNSNFSGGLGKRAWNSGFSGIMH